MKRYNKIFNEEKDPFDFYASILNKIDGIELYYTDKKFQDIDEIAIVISDKSLMPNNSNDISKLQKILNLNIISMEQDKTQKDVWYISIKR